MLGFAGRSVNVDAVAVQLDVLCFLPRDTPLTDVVAEYVRPALTAQLQVPYRRLYVTDHRRFSPWFSGYPAKASPLQSELMFISPPSCGG